MTLYRYKFTAEIYDEYAREDNKEPCRVVRGYISATTFTEAMEKFTRYYGNDAIERIYLRPVTDSPIAIYIDEAADKDNFILDWDGPFENDTFF